MPAHPPTAPVDKARPAHPDDDLDALVELDDDLDALVELGDEIATLAAHIHAATQQWLALIADFDRRRGWELDGHRTCAHWLAFRTGIDLGAAREKVRTARALSGLPLIGASMGRGELSFSQARALSRVATAENEGALLELARGCTTAQLERIVRGWKRGSRGDEAAREAERHQRRTFSVFPDEDGMYLVRGRLEPEVAAVLMRAVEAAADALYRERRVEGLQPEEDTQRAAAQRRADAVGLLAERALAVGFGDGNGAGSGAGSGAGNGAGNDRAPISGTRAERFQVVLHVDAETLAEGAEDEWAEAEGAEDEWAEAEGAEDVGSASAPGPRSNLDDGTRVAAETSRRVACDAALVRITHGPDGSVLDVGRRTRTIPPALRRALEVRDRGCRFPGCGLRFTDAHHVRHWADGGGTSLGNALLVCRVHHRLLHEGGWRVTWWGEGRAVFIDPRGGEHFDGGWEPPAVGPAPVEALRERLHAHGVRADARTAGARWKREADIPDEVYFGALEAMGA